VSRINAHDVDGLCRLMTEDHLFVDSVNSRVRGRENMRSAWVLYFHMIPDFTIEIQEIMSNGQRVGLFGRARGTFSPDGMLSGKNRWEMPAAWRATVEGKLVSEWQIYADNEPVRLLMAGQNP